jgi:ATP-binding cassette, subfamily B, bacterial
MEQDQKKRRATWKEIVAFSFIFKFIKPYRWAFILGLILIVISSALVMIFPGAAGEMANTAIGEPKFDLTVEQYGLLFLVILILQGVMSYYRTILFAIVSEKGMADVRKALYDKMITLDLAFFEENRVGELTSRITTDVEQLQSAFSVSLAEFIRQLVVLVLGVAILSWLTPKLSLIMLATFPVIVILAMVFGRYIRRMSKTRQEALAATNTIVEESFSSFTVVKAFANELYESMRYSKSVQEVVTISLRYARVRGLFFIFIITVLFGGIFFVLWQGAMLVESGEMQVGDLFSFIIYTVFLGGAIASIGNLYTVLAGAVGATERVRDILLMDSELDIPKGDDGERSLKLRGQIRLENVSFKYDSRPDMSVLKDINLSVEPGEQIALVGQSGSGKTTLTKLLMQFYPATSGRIIVDGKPIDAYDLTAYRHNLAIVPQEVLLFGGTIRENILYGRPNAGEDEVIEAAKQSYSWEFIEQLPEGLDTVIGERGVKLSGGQRQRVAIARAILKDPAILILDEATSSLDAESEKYVQMALEKLMRGRTSIVIAHRLATIRNVDRIYVLDHGRIVEQGSHEELTQIENGSYSALAKLQFETQ